MTNKSSHVEATIMPLNDPSNTLRTFANPIAIGSIFADKGPILGHFFQGGTSCGALGGRCYGSIVVVVVVVVVGHGNTV